MQYILIYPNIKEDLKQTNPQENLISVFSNTQNPIHVSGVTELDAAQCLSWGRHRSRNGRGKRLGISQPSGRLESGKSPAIEIRYQCLLNSFVDGIAIVIRITPDQEISSPLHCGNREET
ncbi:hypothetical protein DSO57_1027874 [Entomophthora muscae]|uniref:Uncharacterized protein n=1 Tax=Entomophthora muscae TaxID=34485 RepID=A0ACC2TZY3_9FUNG|nr:hypothetical protein DSO57_1027874 [Entomophthora muscae]